MVERIAAESTMQSKTVISVKPAKDIKAREVSEKEQPAVQTDVSRKRDRFETSGAVTKTEAAKEPKTSEAVSEKQTAAQTDKTRSFDRLELSDVYLSGLSEESTDSANALDASASLPDTVGQSNGNEAASNVDISSDVNDLTYDSSEDVDTNKLYQYTDKELLDFLLDGSITQSEYNAEVEKREG